MTVEVSFRVDDLPLVVSEPVGGGRLVLLSAGALGHPWRLSWAGVDLPGHGSLMSELTDADGKRCEVVSYEASSDELLEASGWWEFDASPETDGPLILKVWVDEPPWPRTESFG